MQTAAVDGHERGLELQRLTQRLQEENHALYQ